MSTTVGGHSGAGPLSLMSCVRESSPLQDYGTEIEKNVVSKRKFWNPKKWFRKKQKTGDDTVAHPHHHEEHRDVDGARSRSTGELSTDEEVPRSHDRNSGSMHPGLSVSHDSVFHPLNSGSSDLELDGAQSSSSLSISQPLGDAKLQTELSSRLRLRRGRGDTSEDDEGLPRSPPCGSPAAANDSYLILEKTANKDLPTKSHSTCSDGSLLSMDSSEIDEDSLGIQSRNSSKVSLSDKRTDQDTELEFGPNFSTIPLNHSAAHHRVSVRPKRTYGAPRRKKGQLSSALPATPEVNEESSTRSISPESATEPITELYSSTARGGLQHKTHLAHHAHTNKLKCNSLPAGITPPTSELFRLSRSRSNAGKSQDDASLHEEEREEKLSLFDRLFPRRSAKKKKKMEESKEREERIVKEEKMAKMEVDGDTRVTEERKFIQTYSTTPTTTKVYSETHMISSSQSHTKREDSKPAIAPRTGAASRQRIQPIDIPVTPKDLRSTFNSVPKSPLSPERSFSPGTSPIQVELENLLKNRQLSHMSSSPKEPLLNTPPQSPKSPRSPKLFLPRNSPLVSKKEFSSHFSSSSYMEAKKESKTNIEDVKSKVKITGLSSLQQRVLSLNSSPDEWDDHKPLSPDFPIKPLRPVAKSHSFKSQKTSVNSPLQEAKEDDSERRKSVTKAASLDSVKNLEEPILKSELKLTLKSPNKPAEKEPAEKEPEVEEIEVTLEKTTPEIVQFSPKNFKVTNDFISNEIKHEEKTSHVKTTQMSTTGSTIKESSSFAVPSKSKVPLISTVYSSAIGEERSVKTVTEPAKIPKSFSNDSITISGPSHTAIVNVTSKSEDFTKTFSSTENETLEKDDSKTVLYRESQVSVTKIQLKHETTQVKKTSVVLPKPSIPEFLNKQLNRVEVRPTSNIILMKSPKVSPEESQNQNVRPKTIFNFPTTDIGNFKSQLPRKFSKDDVEIIEKEKSDSDEGKDGSPPSTPPVTASPTTPTQSRFRKNDLKPSSRKSSVTSASSDAPVKESFKDRALKNRSISLDSLKSDDKGDSSAADKSSQDSLDKLEKRSLENVVLRRKSLVKQKNDDEPELMKVFARRSLKLKDSDVDQIQEAIAEEQRHRDSDKENNTETTPESEKKLFSPKEEKIILEEQPEPPVIKHETKTVKQPLTEIKKTSEIIKNITTKDEPEVQLRRSLNNNIFLSAQRAASLSSPKTVITEFHVKKQASLNERRKTDQWINNAKNEEIIEESKTETKLITSKTEEIRTETKNFSQRRAEWEKRVQQAQK